MKIINLIIFLFLLSSNINSQVVNNINVVNSDSIYNIGVNQVMTIDSLSTFSGSIIINGGTYVNKGLSIPKSLIFSSGNLINTGTFYYPNQLVVGQNANLINEAGAQLNVNDVIMNGSVSNDGLINIVENFIINSESCKNNNIINAKTIGGIYGVLNNGIINVD
jgi:hypothetical protein